MAIVPTVNGSGGGGVGGERMIVIRDSWRERLEKKI